MVNSMLSYSRLSQGFLGEAMAVVRLPDPKLKTLGERGIECIFVGCVEHSKAFRFFVIEPNESVSINSIIESRDVIFGENRLSSVPRPSLSIPKGFEDIGGSVVSEKVTKEDDLKIFDEAMKSQNVAFWKEAINGEIDSIMGNNTWELVDLPPSYKPLEDMELESTNSAPTAKLPILKLENGDSWVSLPQTTQENGITVTNMSIRATAEEKTNTKNDVKARGLLLMALPNEHQLTFNQYPDAKSMFAAIETRFGVIWMNKPEVETMSIDDLYNNFKIVKQKVKKFFGTSSGGQNLAFITAPSTSSTNDANTACPQVSAVSPSVNSARLEQIHEDDLEAMDLKWQLSLLSVRSMKYYQRTGKKIFINANDIAGYDKSKLNESEFKATTYKRGLATLEDQIITYKKNEVLFSEEVAVLKREVSYKNSEINVLKSELEKVKQEKDGIDFKIEKFDKASKDLDQLLGSQITDKSKKGLGYSAVPPPHPLIYNRPNKLDLSYSGLDEFKALEFKGYGPKDSVQESKVVCEKESDNSKENSNESLVEEQVSQDKSRFVESSPNVDKETVFLLIKRSYKGQVNVVRVRGVNAVKSSAYWVWRPTKSNGVSLTFKRHNYIDAHMAYQGNFKEFNGGYVAFGGGAYGGRITSKGTLKTDNLDFEDNRVFSSQAHSKTPYELSIGFKPALSFMRPFGCHVTILNTLNNLGKFDGKSDKGTSKEVSQDCIVMPIWKDTSYFDSPTKDVNNGEPKTTDDAQKQVEDSLNNENVEQERFADDSSTKDVNAAGQHINTDVNTGSLKLNAVGPSINTASPNDQDNTEEEPEVDLGNITNSYIVPTTPNTRIHKDHPINNVIGEVKSTVQTRRMSKPTSKQGSR
ncbi:hypothetical protein Tco_0105112 [Tanacetum coccineum]